MSALSQVGVLALKHLLLIEMCMSIGNRGECTGILERRAVVRSSFVAWISKFDIQIS